MKKIFFLLLLLLLVRPVWGEEYTPISTPQDLMEIAGNPSGSYELAEDIDMAGIDWQCFDFSGTLDGRGHSILNLTIASPGENWGTSLDGNQRAYDTRFAGLFATVENAQLRNINLVNVRSVLTCDQPVFLGGFAGRSLNSTIADCSVSGCLELRAHDRIFGLGGVVGYGSGEVSGCEIDVTLICTDTDSAVKDEQFLGGVYATGFMSVSDNRIRIDGYSSEHGYAHNGGIAGMMLQYPLGSGGYAAVARNTVVGKITFFEDNADRRAYCEGIIGEILAWGYTIENNAVDFVRDERYDYDRELRPDSWEDSVCSQREAASH